MATRERMPAAAQEALVTLYGCGMILTKYAAEYERLARRVPNGYRDLRLLHSTLDRLTARILDTVPVDQLRRMERQMDLSEIRVVVRSLARQKTDHWVVSRDDLAYLLNLAAEGACLMCDDTAGHSCRLRQLMDELPVTQDGKAAAVISCKRGGRL